MIFDLLLYGAMALPAIAAYYNTKEKKTLNEHVVSALVISLFVFLTGILAYFEQQAGLPQLITGTTIAISGTTTNSFLLPVSSFIASFIVYIAVSIMAYIVDWSEEQIKIKI